MKKGTNNPNSYCGFVDQSVRNFMINWIQVMTGIDAISPALIHAARWRAKSVVPGPAEAWLNAAEGDLVIAIVPLGQSRGCTNVACTQFTFVPMYGIGSRKNRMRNDPQVPREMAPDQGRLPHLVRSRNCNRISTLIIFMKCVFNARGGNYNVMKNAAISLSGGGNRTLYA